MTFGLQKYYTLFNSSLGRNCLYVRDKHKETKGDSRMTYIFILVVSCHIHTQSSTLHYFCFLVEVEWGTVPFLDTLQNFFGCRLQDWLYQLLVTVFMISQRLCVSGLSLSQSTHAYLHRWILLKKTPTDVFIISQHITLEHQEKIAQQTTKPSLFPSKIVRLFLNWSDMDSYITYNSHQNFIPCCRMME